MNLHTIATRSAAHEDVLDAHARRTAEHIESALSLQPRAVARRGLSADAGRAVGLVSQVSCAPWQRRNAGILGVYAFDAEQSATEFAQCSDNGVREANPCDLPIFVDDGDTVRRSSARPANAPGPRILPSSGVAAGAGAPSP